MTTENLSLSEGARAVRVVTAGPGAALQAMSVAALDPAEFSLVASVDSVPEMVRLALGLAADVVLIGRDLDEPDLENAIANLSAHDVASLVVSSRPMDPAGSRLLIAGASGFVYSGDAYSGDEESADLASAVRAVAHGRSALHPDVAWAVLQQWRAMSANDSPRAVSQLSGRETEVLRAMADGLTTKAIARRLELAQKTVEAHRTRLYSKLGARNQSHAVSIALKGGWLDLLDEERR